MMAVAPLAGAWIEIRIWNALVLYCGSLPSRERGLKFCRLCQFYFSIYVAPLAGAWIEIGSGHAFSATAITSLPSRERGLKSVMGAFGPVQVKSRSPRGSVD